MNQDELDASLKTKRDKLKADITAEVDSQHANGSLRTLGDRETVEGLIDSLFANELRHQAKSEAGSIDVRKMLVERLRTLNAPKD